MMSLAIVGAALATLGAAGSAIGGAISAKKQREQLQTLQNEVQSDLDNLDTDEAEALAKITTMIDALDPKLRANINEAIGDGVKALNKQYDIQLEQIQYGLDEAKKTAGRAERDELERLDEYTKEARKEFRKADQHLTDSLTRRGLGGSGALIAGINKNREQASKLEAEVKKSSDKTLRSIREGIENAEARASFQQSQTGQNRSLQEMQLRSQLGQQLNQSLLNLEQQKIGYTASIGGEFRQTERDLKAQKQDLGMAQSATPSAGESVFNVLGSTLSGAGQGISGIAGMGK